MPDFEPHKRGNRNNELFKHAVQGSLFWGFFQRSPERLDTPGLLAHESDGQLTDLGDVYSLWLSLALKFGI